MIGFIKTYPADFIFFIGLFGGKKSQENQLNATHQQKTERSHNFISRKLKEATAKNQCGSHLPDWAF